MATFSNERFQLPTIHFVGGGSEELVVHTYLPSRLYPFNLSGYDCRFSLVDYAGKDVKIGTPLLLKLMDIERGEDDVLSVLRVKLDPEDTIGLHGKFVYQISIRDIYGDIEPPSQGIFYIYNNIDKTFIEE